MHIDIHQHLWPAELVAALRRRRHPPMLRGWTLELNGEPAFAVDPRTHDVIERARLAASDGLDRALVSLSSPLGLELLPPREALPLLDAYHDGVRALPAPFAAWAAAGLVDIDPDRLAAHLDAGCVGLQLPATSLLDERGYDHCGPLLAVLEQRDKPLFVHPGPAGWTGTAGGTGTGAAGGTGTGGRSEPAWWPALVPYVQQLHAAWFALRAFGRSRHPRLRVGFAALAGLAPLHAERLSARGGGTALVDRLTFLETSSYGERAVDAVVRAVGIDVIVSGSDRPYAGPAAFGLGAAADHAIRVVNPRRLLSGAGR
jgi:hypothetical protein